MAAYDLQPAVIVMDLMMPVLDGLEAARLIRAIDELRNTRVIAYTAGQSPPTSELFTAILRKPSPARGRRRHRQALGGCLIGRIKRDR